MYYTNAYQLTPVLNLDVGVFVTVLKWGRILYNTDLVLRKGRVSRLMGDGYA